MTNIESLKLQLYDKINLLAKSRIDGLNKEMNDISSNIKLDDVDIFDLKKVNDGKIPVRQLWRWFKKLLKYYDL